MRTYKNKLRTLTNRRKLINMTPQSDFTTNEEPQTERKSLAKAEHVQSEPIVPKIERFLN